MDHARTSMMEKSVSNKYWREVVSIAIYTLDSLQVKKGINATPFELWYGYAPKVKYFKIFRTKFYIFKDNMNEKSMQRVMKVYSKDIPLRVKLISV